VRANRINGDNYMNSWSIEDEKRYFDDVASRTTLEEFKKRLDNRMNDALWPTIFGKIGNLMDRQVLDLGCGLGYDSAIFASKGAKVVGIDISSRCVEKAELFLKSLGFERNTQFRVMDVRSLDFPEKHFDLVFGRRILHHIDLERCLKDVHHLVKDKCCFVEPFASNPIGGVSRTGHEVPAGESPKSVEIHPLPFLELSKLIQVMEKEFLDVWHKEYENNMALIVTCARGKKSDYSI